MGDIFSQLVGNKLAHADGRKCSSEWSTNTINVPARDILKVVAAVMDYALRLFFSGVYEPMDFDIDVGNDNEIFSSL